MASTYHADIQALYVAYFNRPADYLGLDFWEKAIENAVAAAGTDPAKQAAAKAATLAQISAGFAASDEYLDVYGGLPTEQVIGQVYQNLFGHAPDLAGLVFWVNAVRAGHMTIANAVTTIAAGAQGTDKEAIENKVAAAVAFSNEFDTGEEVLAYNDEDALIAAKQWMSTITTDASLAAAIAPATLKATVAAVVDAGQPEPVVTEHVLTAGIDTIPGTAGIDVITGVISTTDANSFTNLDTIDGGTGADVLNINMLDTAGGTIGTNVSVTNVETVNVRSAGPATVTSTGWTGLNTLNVTQSAAATVTAASTTAVNVTGATGAVIVSGGSNVTVAGADTVTVDGSTNVDVAATGSGKAVTIGATTAVKGAVTVNHTKLAAGAIAVDGGTSVSITAAGQTTGTISVGQGGAAADLPSGAVTINATGAASVAATDVTLGNIAVDGGTTVVINQTATSSSAAAAADATGATITQSAVTVDGSAKTTSVTVNQTAAVGEVLAVTAVAGANEVQTVTFGALTSGTSLTINGLMFTASKDLTAAQVAAAFSNLAAGATVGSAPAGNGVYSGTFNTLGFTSGAVTTSNGVSTVALTGTTKADLAAVTIVGAAATATTTTAGAGATAAVTGVLGVANGAVTINGAITGTDVLATVNLDAYGTANVTSDALTALNLANSSAGVTVTNAAATSMTLGLNNVGSAINLGGTYTSLTVNASGDESATAITAGGVTSLTVAGDQFVDLSGSAMGVLKTVAVNGSASVKADLSGATVTSVNAGGTSGDMEVSIDASKATYTGSTGADDVTLTSSSVTKAVNTGSGDDLVELAVGTTGTSITVAVNGGTGTDTLAMAAATATIVSGTDVFETKVEGFDKLHLGVVATTVKDVVDLSNMDDISYVISAGATAGAGTELELNKMGANGTLELQGAGVLVDVNLTDATGTTDVFNIVTKADGSLDYGIVDVAGVETVNISVIDTDTSSAQTATLTLADAAAKTVVLSGGAVTLNLDAGVTALTTVNGSALTGKLTYATNGSATGAQTVTGGAGSDALTANRNNDVLNGGAGNDTLKANGDLNVLTGGAGADTFDISDVTSNVNSYATITDLAAGDKIKFAAAAADFAAAKITLADTAVFQDYANAAISTTDAGDVSWFQFGGNTYVILNVSDTATSFVNGTDMIVKVTGAVDLSTSSFSSSADILLIGGPST